MHGNRQTLLYRPSKYAFPDKFKANKANSFFRQGEHREINLWRVFPGINHFRAIFSCASDTRLQRSVTGTHSTRIIQRQAIPGRIRSFSRPSGKEWDCNKDHNHEQIRRRKNIITKIVKFDFLYYCKKWPQRDHNKSRSDGVFTSFRQPFRQYASEHRHRPTSPNPDCTQWTWLGIPPSPRQCRTTKPTLEEHKDLSIPINPWAAEPKRIWTNFLLQQPHWCHQADTLPVKRVLRTSSKRSLVPVIHSIQWFRSVVLASQSALETLEDSSWWIGLWCCKPEWPARNNVQRRDRLALEGMAGWSKFRQHT